MHGHATGGGWEARVQKRDTDTPKAVPPAMAGLKGPPASNAEGVFQISKPVVMFRANSPDAPDVPGTLPYPATSASGDAADTTKGSAFGHIDGKYVLLWGTVMTCRSGEWGLKWQLRPPQILAQEPCAAPANPFILASPHLYKGR